MSMVPPLKCIEVGVVVERLKATSHWIDFIWRSVSVLSGQPDTAPWTVLAGDGDCMVFYAGPAEIMLYRTETGQYRDNLVSGTPSLWVRAQSAPIRPIILGVTADPAEGESWTQAGSDLVDAVPMPAAVGQTIEAFVAEHHVEQAFAKRTRHRVDPEVLGRRRLEGKSSR